MTADSITWILFDLGNVLVDYKPEALSVVADFLGVATEDLCTFFDETNIGDKLATGRLGPQEFVDILNERFDASLTQNHIVSWFGPEIHNVYPEIPPLIQSLKKKYFLGILSNTFFGHWDYFITTDLAQHFDVLMPSHILGYIKPDIKVYREALARMGTVPAEIIFIDDNKDNVDAARVCGIHSFQSTSPQATISGLKQFGIVF